MEDTLLRIPVVCPECMKESLTQIPNGEIAEALAAGAPICLSAQCHGKSWQATAIEREQLREYLEALNFSGYALALAYWEHSRGA